MNIITENEVIVAENVTIMTDKKVNKENFKIKNLGLNLTRGKKFWTGLIVIIEPCTIPLNSMSITCNVTILYGKF